MEQVIKLGVQLFGCRKEFRRDPEGFMDRIREAGYTQLEPCILFDKPEESDMGRCFAGELWEPGEVAGFREAMEKRGLVLSSAHVFCSDTGKHLEELCRLAQENGITAYVFNLPRQEAGKLQGFAESLKTLAAALGEAGCEVWLHNTQGNLAGEPGESPLERVLELTRGTAGIYTQIDTGWAMYDGRIPDELIAIPDIRLHGLHIKDMAEGFGAKEGDDIFAVLGEGCTVLELVLQNAAGLPWVIDQDLSKGDFLADLSRSAQAVRQAVDALQQRRGTEQDTSHDHSVLEIYDVETGERTVLHEFPYLIEAPNWSKDGKFLVYNSGGRLFRYGLETGESLEIDTGFADKCNNDHVLSPDGGSIAISHSNTGWKSQVYTVSLEGGTPKEITPNGPSFLHGWSPDGKWLAYCAFRDFENGADIYVIPAEGGEELRLTTARGLNDGPEYDPTGEYIWFNSVRTGLMQAWRMKADGSEQTQMTFDGEWNTWFPHVSPDGKWVVMIAYRKGDVAPGEHVPHKDVELRLMRNPGLEGSNGTPEVETVVELFGGQGTINVNSWAPDSKKFAFVSYRLE